LLAWTKRTVRSLWSGRWTGNVRELLPLLCGVMLTGLALAAAGHRIDRVEKDIRRQANPVEVVVASVQIPTGATFTQGNLAKKAVPASGTGGRNVPATEFELLLGASAKYAIEPGEPVLWTDVQEPFETEPVSALVRPGRRALTVPADASTSFAGLLLPGDRVDILAEAGDAKASTWIRDVSVIAVDQRRDRLGRPSDTPEAATVTLMVAPGEGARIACAGRLHWFLRNPVDNGFAARRPARPRSIQSPVEIWKAGIKVSPSGAAPGGPG
jgi:Flp pilus assembly protein CpaB